MINQGYLTTEKFLKHSAGKVAKILCNKLNLTTIKVFFVFTAIFEIKGEGETKSIYTKTDIIFKRHWILKEEKKSLEKWFLERAMPKLWANIEEFTGRGSGYTLREILNSSIHINKYDALNAGSYFPLPATLVQQRALFNIKNLDNFCFLWSIIKQMYPEKLKKANVNPQTCTKKRKKYMHYLKNIFQNMRQNLIFQWKSTQ